MANAALHQPVVNAGNEFVSEDQRRIADQGPRDRGALLFAARHLRWLMMDAMTEADQLTRISTLVLAIVEIAGQSPEPLASPKGMAGLQAVAQGKCITAGGTKDGGGNLQATWVTLTAATPFACTWRT